MPLSSRMPELGSLEVLVAVARTGSLNTAAREFGVSQQAVSARVASLEAQIGTQLLTRSTHGSTPTPSGRLVVEWADRLLQVAAEVDAGLATLRREARSRVRVSASLTIAEYLLPGWLVSLRSQALAHGTRPQNVVLTATNSDHVLEQVRAGTADLGFVEGPRLPRGVRSRVVAHDELVVVVAAAHPWTRLRRPLSARQLADTPLVSREQGSGTRDVLSAALAGALGPDAVLSEPALELSTTAAVRAAVLAGAGAAAISRLAVADDLAAGRLVAVATDGLALRRDLRAVWLGARVPPAGAVRDLLAHIG